MLAIEEGIRKLLQKTDAIPEAIRYRLELCLGSGETYQHTKKQRSSKPSVAIHCLTSEHDFKLQTLCQYFDIPLRPEAAHDALNDVRATMGLYRAMLSHTWQVEPVIEAA